MPRRPRRTGSAYVDNEREREITFFKRRNGLFKGASDMSILTGASVLIVLEDQNRGKFHSFGSPQVRPIVDAALSGDMAAEEPFADEEMRARLAPLERELARLEFEASEKKNKRKESKARFDQAKGEAMEDPRGIAKLFFSKPYHLNLDEMKLVYPQLTRIQRDIAVRLPPLRRRGNELPAYTPRARAPPPPPRAQWSPNLFSLQNQWFSANQQSPCVTGRQPPPPSPRSPWTPQQLDLPPPPPPPPSTRSPWTSQQLDLPPPPPPPPSARSPWTPQQLELPPPPPPPPPARSPWTPQQLDLPPPPSARSPWIPQQLDLPPPPPSQQLDLPPPPPSGSPWANVLPLRPPRFSSFLEVDPPHLGQQQAPAAQDHTQPAPLPPTLEAPLLQEAPPPLPPPSTPLQMTVEAHPPPAAEVYNNPAEQHHLQGYENYDFIFDSAEQLSTQPLVTSGDDGLVAAVANGVGDDLFGNQLWMPSPIHDAHLCLGGWVPGADQAGGSGMADIQQQSPSIWGNDIAGAWF